MRWQVGITTVPVRFGSTLHATLASIKSGGFEVNRLFIDGLVGPLTAEKEFGVPATIRHPNVKTYGNFYLGLLELYLRDPCADRYAMFQDDLVMCRNVRPYLDECPLLDNEYMNLYTFPSNESLIAGRGMGWHPSNQMGRGALTLVFSRGGVQTLLTSPWFIGRAIGKGQDKTTGLENENPSRGWKNLDGGIIESFKRGGGRELVHYPSLTQHTGVATSSMRAFDPNHPEMPTSKTFPGENWDAMELKKGARI